MNNYSGHTPSTDELLQMAEKYFNATLSEQEEQLLKHFAATTSDPRLNELKAVMGLCAYGKHRHTPTKRHKPILWRMSAAACIAVLIATTAITISKHTSPATVAYIGGIRTTDEEIVMQQMHSVMHDINISNSDDYVENELQNIFSTLN